MCELFIHATAVTTRRAFSGTVLPWQRQRQRSLLLLPYDGVGDSNCDSDVGIIVSVVNARCFYFGSVLFGFGSFVRLSVTQWVERTLGLVGFVSHTNIRMFVYALSIVVFPLCSKYAALCIYVSESCTCNAAFVYVSLAMRALSLSFASRLPAAANSIDARIFQMSFLRRK